MTVIFPQDPFTIEAPMPFPALKSDADTFVTPKCATAIHVANPYLKSALVTAALDGAVRAIDVLPSAYAPPGCGRVVVLDRDDGRFALDVVPARPLIDVDTRRLLESALRSLGLAPMVLTLSDLGNQRFAVAQRIWLHREFAVPLTVRLQVRSILQEDGPLNMDELLRRIRADRDPLKMVCAMACADKLVIDIDQPLDTTTRVRSR